MTVLRHTFEEQLTELQQDILRMSSVVEDMIRLSMHSLAHRDVDEARRAQEMDDIVDELNLKIENNCLHLLALQQPMARDLRVIAAALKIITDVERMGDYTVDIAKMSIRLVNAPASPSYAKLQRMSEVVIRMLRETLQAFVSHDLDLIQSMIAGDDEVDRLNREVHSEVLEQIQQNPSSAELGIGVILMSRFLERIADHCTNVGERVYYMQTGELRELHT
ncbi:MAG: phosphate transport system regulatory protein PhoU [Armatimonadota bacterium]|nr:MAG: phosphate transport system regulatory protein PhoU [Armatimonadota bacterium]